MKHLFHRVAILLLAVMAGGLTGCLFRTQPTLVLRTDLVTARNKMNKLVASRGAQQQPASSAVLGHPIGNPRYVIYGLFPEDMHQTLPALTEVELAPYRKGLTRLSARTRSPILSSIVPAHNPARDSAALRACADYIERGVRPAQLQVWPWDEFQRRVPGGSISTNEMGDYNLRELQEVIRLHNLQRRAATNQFAPPAQTPDWAKPELKLK